MGHGPSREGDRGETPPLLLPASSGPDLLGCGSIMLTTASIFMWCSSPGLQVHQPHIPLFPQRWETLTSFSHLQEDLWTCVIKIAALKVMQDLPFHIDAALLLLLCFLSLSER